MKARFSIALVSAATVVISAACSSSPPAPPDQTVSEFCGDWAKAFCQISTICQFDATACATNQTAVCMSFVSSAQTGTRQYSQPAGKSCIDALNSAYANNPSSISAAQVETLRDTCNKAFPGSVATNKPCTSNYDCTSGLVCAQLVGGAGSACGPLTPKNLGDACADPGDQCQGNSYCAASGGLATCIATPATGGTCSAAIPCGASDRCVGGTCAPRASIGGACASDSDCVSGVFCDLYPPASCASALTFARGSYDCNGIAGSTTVIADAGVADTSTPATDSSTTDSATGTDSATSTDAPTGG